MFLQTEANKDLNSKAAPARAGGKTRRGNPIRFARLAGIISAAALIPANAGAAIGGGAYGKDLHKAAAQHNDRYYRARPYSGQAAAESQAEIVPASLGGMARALPTGIYTASASVTTACFNPRMISLLKTIQTKYHRPLIITSGYRSPIHNIRAGGVKGSLHMACAAADIKIPGVNKYALASYVRSLPNRGGVGLYCHNAVHVDIGSPRQWNWCATGRPKD